MVKSSIQKTEEPKEQAIVQPTQEAPVAPAEKTVEQAPVAEPYSRDILIAYATSLADENVNDGALVNIALAGEQYFTADNYKTLLDGMKTFLETNRTAPMGVKLAELQRLSAL